MKVLTSIRIKLVFVGLLLSLFAIACFSGDRRSYETGLEEFPIEGSPGTIKLIATGRASEQAISQGSLAMKQTTACAAAKVMLRQRLRTSMLSMLESKFVTVGVELLNANEYCRIHGIYNPDGLPAEFSRRGIDADRI